MPKYLCIQVYPIAGTSIGYQKEGARPTGAFEWAYNGSSASFRRTMGVI